MIKKLFVSLLILPAFLVSENFTAIEEILSLQSKNIGNLTSAINASVDKHMELKLLNERGLRYFLVGNFERAFKDLKTVVDSSLEDPEFDPSLLATALWGQLLCYAFTDAVNESFQILSMLKKRFQNPCSEEYCLINSVPNFQNNTCLFADFANANERISPEECKERVRGTAQLMRALVLKVPNRSVAGAIQLSIAELENSAYSCCELEHWTKCLSPIVDAWEYLKNSMEKGVKIVPYLPYPI